MERVQFSFTIVRYYLRDTAPELNDGMRTKTLMINHQNNSVDRYHSVIHSLYHRSFSIQETPN